MTATRNAPRNFLLLFLPTMTFAEAIEAFDLTFFSPDDFSEDVEAMDAHFGITGYVHDLR